MARRPRVFVEGALYHKGARHRGIDLMMIPPGEVGVGETREQNINTLVPGTF